MSYACGTSGTPADEHLGSGALTDSLKFSGTFRAIAYPGDPDHYVYPDKGGPTPPIQTYLQGTLTR